MQLACFLQPTVHLPYKWVKLIGFPVYQTHVLHCQEQSHYASLLSKELYCLFLSLQNKPSWSCDWILPECGPTHASPSLFPIPRWFTCILFFTVISPPISICPILFFEVMKSLFFTSLGSINCLVLCLYNLWLMLIGHQHMVGSLCRRSPLLGYRKLRKEPLSFKLLRSQNAQPGRGCLLVTLDKLKI